MSFIEKRQREKGRGYVWRARYRNSEGKERSRTFPTKDEAEDFLALQRSALRSGTWVDPRLGKTPFGDYANEWLKTKTSVRPRTKINIEGRLANHILPRFGERPLRSIRPSEVRAFVSELCASHAPSTVKAIYRTFAQIMTTAEIDGFIGKTPCVGIELPKETATDEMHFLTPTQVASLAHAVDERFSAAIITAAYTGMRAGELWALEKARVNLLARRIEVRASVSEVRGALVTGPTKTGANRTITLPPFLADMLGRHLGAFPGKDRYVFTSPEGLQVRHRNFMSRHFYPTIERLQLDGLRFHDLRHTHAAILIAQGWSAKQIQERLGHSSIRVTFDRYGHLFDGHDDTLISDLDAAGRESLAAHSRPEMALEG